MTTDSTIAITAQSAAVLHAALNIAIDSTEDVLRRNSKSSQPYRAASWRTCSRSTVPSASVWPPRFL
jgi:hypothetical protein